MNIDKALERLEWRFKNGWTPKKLDVEAYNAIVAYRKRQSEITTSDNESLAKLWVHQLILLANSNMYSGQRCIQVLDEILSKSVYEWCLVLKDELPAMKFNANGQENVEDLITEISEEDVIKFVNLHINRIISKFDL